MKIAIVGAGPAGLISAWQLAEQGNNITLFERMHDLRRQGSGVLLQPVGLKVLELLGVRQQVEALGRKIYRLDGFSSPSNIVSVAVDYRKLKGDKYALAIDRTIFWDFLFKRTAALNIPIINNTIITDLSYEDDSNVTLQTQCGKNLTGFDLIVDASGANSSLHKHGTKTTNSKVLEYGSLWSKVNIEGNSIYNNNAMTLFSNTDNNGIGLLPTGSIGTGGMDTMTLFFNLKWQDCPDWNKDNFVSWKKKIIHQWPETQSLIEQIISPDQLYLAKFMQHTLLKPYGDKIVFIGDAAHASNPQLGQGINMSLVDAITLPWALSKNISLTDSLKLHARVRRNHVVMYQALARILTPFYQSDNQLAINFRNVCYPIFSKLFLVGTATAKLISGELGQPLRHFQQKK